MLQHTSLTAVEFFNDMLHEHTVTVRVHLYLKYYQFATYGFVNKSCWHFLILTIVFEFHRWKELHHVVQHQEHQK